MATARTNVENLQGHLPLDCPLRGDIHGDRSVMDFPFFSLEKKPKNGVIEHRIGNTTITIRAGEGGIATMYDKEIILYVASLIYEKILRGQSYTQEMIFTAHDFFRATGTPNPGKRDYQRFTDAMSRLQGTQIQTNLKTGGAGHRGWFSWIENAQALYDDAPEGFEKLRAVKVRLCDFLFRAIERDATMYSYDHEYFQLGLIERRLYEIARSHVAERPFEIDLEQLYKTVGSRSVMRRFKQHLMEIERADSLPRYEISIREVVEGDRVRAKPTETLVTFSQRPKGAVPRAIQNTLDLIEA
ncbi:plasmid replication initiation protein [Sphingomonas zeicaulis]|uniref:replication initiator protein A n=1 Tax=Sphingomonas zeicaulis TaxID=1632740 RepID=UPI003D1ED5ED